ncbi:UDP-glucuronosyl/UDP-glucosyltransferase [Corchorus olitorius]|uniref:UDP-glucuronosyl/UDP-glucosyltransferase n=1 Tax=Corchorus olitorius TaxID=93759 RepID=A0A1R3KQZ6_9ROSI|nr:UDP-glucuronosyl/UDP-glucosyltransferase [Corchorus olitorius]
MPRPHFLLVSYAAQGHINPTLQFAKCLIRIGAHVTFTTSLSARRRMTEVPKAEGLSFVTFSDGYDDGLKPNDDREKFGAEFKRRGTENLNNLIASSNDEGKPITCIVYSLLLHWAMEVAREHQIPCAMLWIQPASVFDIYYFYFNGYEETIKRQAEDEAKCLIKLPGLPPLANRDLPSFVGNQSAYPAAINFFQKQFELVAQETNPKILVNTFDALEPEALNGIEKFKMIGPTNAKLIEDVWGNGVRVRGNEEGIVERDEINRCLDLVMGDGERAKEVRRNAEKWKDLAREASKEGGSLDRNLKSFIDDLEHKD